MSSDRNDSQIEICPDGHHCLNGSKCAENPYDEGSYYCDCEEYVFEVRYEGLYCEHKAEVYCTSHGSSTHSFCTNGGICVEYEGPEQSFMGCKCPDQYEGTHCQFVKGTKPKDWPFTSQMPRPGEVHKTTNVGAITGSSIFSITFIVIAMAFAYKRYYSKKEDYDQMDSRQLSELQCDGDAMEGVENIESLKNGRGGTIISSKQDSGIV